MKLSLPSGVYIVAVSGGLDSVVLLDSLVKANTGQLELIVAHLDHGIRPESADDANFVRDLASKFRLAFELETAQLGHQASEATARQTRYLFLGNLSHKYQAQAIVTAHHRNDVFETAILNLLRGTGRHGLSSLRSSSTLIRPLLNYHKQDLLKYAQANKLSWREDATNQDQRYRRNYIRHQICPRFKPADKLAFLSNCDQLAQLNPQIDSLLAAHLTAQSTRRAGRVFSRYWFNMLPHQLAKEVVYYWLREAQTSHYDQAKIDYLVSKLKTLKPGKQLQVSPTQTISLTKRSLRLQL